jgi:hypothetical protein
MPFILDDLALASTVAASGGGAAAGGSAASWILPMLVSEGLSTAGQMAATPDVKETNPAYGQPINNVPIDFTQLLQAASDQNTSRLELQNRLPPSIY